MNELNRDNFLRWGGNFIEAPFEITANDDTVSTTILFKSVEISPLVNDVATYGFNKATLQITLQDNTVKPAYWNPVTEKITYFLPDGVTPGNRLIKYRFMDMNGNLSNEATIIIEVNERPFTYIGYGPSFSCGTGGLAGYGIYGQLIKKYTDNNQTDLTSIIENDPESEYYIEPFLSDSCSSTGSYAWDMYFVTFPANVSQRCTLGVLSQYYTQENFFSTGIFLYANDYLTAYAVDGYYRLGGIAYRVYNGQIVDITYCS